MNYIQIWIGKKPRDIIINCMNSVINKVNEEDLYTLISTNNFLKSNKKVKWININTYELEFIKDNLLFKLWNYISQIEINNYVKASCKSDLIRLHYLANNDNTLYLDTDVFLKEKIMFTESKPYFALERRGYRDSFISYNGNNKDFFKKILNDLIMSCYNIRRDKFYISSIKRSWIFELINLKYKNESAIIDNKYYEHLNMFSGKK